MKINDLLTIKIVYIEKDSIVFTPKTHKWCTLPYIYHPKGCPNYNKNDLCPPNVRIMDEKMKEYNFFYLIYGTFNIFQYRNYMLNIHPNWSERKASCVLYWQGAVKKILKEYIKRIYRINPEKKFYLFSSGSGFIIKEFQQHEIYSMEAAGINVFKTLKNNGISYEIKPINFIKLVNLLCSFEEINLDD